MTKGLFHLVLFIGFFLLAGNARANNGLNYQLSDSIICKGDSALCVIRGCSGAQILPSQSVTWLDSAHALLHPNATTTYTILGTSFSHNDDTAYVTITVSSPQINILADKIPCHGGQATIFITGTDGFPPYSGDGIYSSLAGTHYFYIQDSYGCVASDSIHLTEPAPLSPNESVGSIRCFGDSAPVTITTTGGTPPYTGTGVFYVPAGVQNFIIADSNHCSTSISVTVTQPQPVFMQVISNSIRCFGDSATITVTAFGGTPQYTGTGIFREGPGSYVFVVTDLAGCTASDSLTIIQPPPLQVSISADTSTICSGDTITMCATEGFAAYHWNNGDTGTCAFILSGGNYYVTVSDQNNCTAESNHLAANVLQPPAVTVSIKGDTLMAFNAVAYQWYVNEQPIHGATSSIYIGHTGQEYQVLVTDSEGCTALSNPLGITGINNIAQQSFDIYPNPFGKNGFRLMVDKELSGAELEIFTEEGKVIYHSKIEAGDSEISFDAPAAVYFIRISTTGGSLVKRLVKLQ